MSITAIARQAQGIRAGEVIAKLAEDVYFMRVDNRVTQPPPTRNRDNEATSRSADLGRNRTRAELPAQPNRTRANAGGPSQGGNSNREVVPHRGPDGGGCDPDGGGSNDGSSNHGANRRAGGGGNRGGRDHANSHASGASQGGYDAHQKIEELRRKKSTTAGTTTASPPSHLGFATCSSPTSSNLWGSPSTTRSRIPSSGSGATPSPSSRWTSTRSTSGTS
jgi:hypothetical protein